MNMEEPTVANSNARRIIYVDASYNHETKESKISLYDKEIGKLDTLTLNKPSNSGEAEKAAVLYACIYKIKKDLNNQKIHILNDNTSAVNDKNILIICKYFNVNVSWIPREVNIIADKGTKLETNINQEESRIVEMLYDILVDDTMSLISKTKKIYIEDKKNTVATLKKALNHTKSGENNIAAIGQVGKYLKENNPTFKYSSLKKELEKYEDDFVIVDNNYVKIK